MHAILYHAHTISYYYDVMKYLHIYRTLELHLHFWGQTILVNSVEPLLLSESFSYLFLKIPNHSTTRISCVPVCLGMSLLWRSK